MNGECEEAVSSQRLGRGPNKSETTSSPNIHTRLYMAWTPLKHNTSVKYIMAFF